MVAEITYPFEIMSDSGGRWVYYTNFHGHQYHGGEFVNYATVSCEEIVGAIESEHFLWPKGSCLYMGPLTQEQPDGQ